MKQCSCLDCTHGCTSAWGFLFKSFGIGSIIDQILETCTGEHRSAAVFLYKGDLYRSRATLWTWKNTRRAQYGHVRQYGVLYYCSSLTIISSERNSKTFKSLKTNESNSPLEPTSVGPPASRGLSFQLQEIHLFTIFFHIYLSGFQQRLPMGNLVSF